MAGSQCIHPKIKASVNELRLQIMNYRVFVGLFLKEDGKEVFLNVIIYYKYNMNINIIKINRKKNYHRGNR